ncbi:toll/interleukin-1 receptor domain-containing protein [Draconibacterium mangrovi]|uniref:toll/interleukin-1 receptor domain-containing protein n=1 Tax=Draconibacterium mangrovi TaxID=2697469 RepID=UPI001952AFE4|nr:TIR domain-containing protein [Draconibacterium mangrovi]
MKIPRVFLSYSHDSMEHKKWILDLATKLRTNGIDAIIDQWELKAGDDIPSFMENNLQSSDYILMICTEKYVEKANSGKGGVGYEKMIITSNLLQNINENKIIPIIRQKGTYKVPTFLKTKLYLNFSISSEFEFNYDELIRTIHQSPLFEKPEIGNNPFKEINDDKKNPNAAVKNLMQGAINLYEEDYDQFDSSDLSYILKISKIYSEMLIREAIQLGLLKGEPDGQIKLTEKGKFYAIENKLI